MRTSLSLAVLTVISGFCQPASADPPYGDDFDAPETFDGAVLIAPGWYDGTTGIGDVDFYKFTVAEGQNIDFKCTLDGTFFFVPPYYYYDQDCVSALIDPEGNEHNDNLLASPVSSPFVERASAGEWRVRIANGVPSNAATPAYWFYLHTADASSGPGLGPGGGSGGALDLSMSLFLGLAAARRLGRGLAGMTLLAAAALAACSSGTSGGGSCVTISAGGTQVSWSADPQCTDCAFVKPAEAIDGDLGTYAGITFREGEDVSGRASIRATAQDGIVFPAGNVAGAVITDYLTNVSTFLDGVLQEELTEENFEWSEARHFSGIRTTKPFDAVEVTFVHSSGCYGVPCNAPYPEQHFRIYEFCSDAL